MTKSIACAILACSLAACGGQGSADPDMKASNDAATPDDAAPSDDAALPQLDGGSPSIDGAAPPLDGGSPSDPFALPPNATSAAHLETSSAWAWKHDPGTKGSSTGTSELDPAPDGSASRRFDASYDDAGGEIFHLSYGKDEVATHFVYENYVYVTDPSSLENLEMDMNQVVADGDTIIYGFQCAHASHKWEYTLNAGTPANPKDQWYPSNVACDPMTFSANTWHHVQVAYHRDGSGNVTYDAVALDGNEEALVGATGPSAFTLGWPKGDLLTNFQLDGAGASGSITVYAKDLTISRW